MFDGEISNTVTVWGVPVPVLSNGRRKWPEAVRAMAVERIAAGARIRDIAAETGAHKSLVAKWVREPRAGGAEEAPAFVEVLLPAGKPAPRQERPVAPPPPPDTPFCRVRLGDAEIEIPPGYPTAHLVDILRAVREVQ